MTASSYFSLFLSSIRPFVNLIFRFFLCPENYSLFLSILMSMLTTPNPYIMDNGHRFIDQVNEDQVVDWHPRSLMEMPNDQV